MKAVRMFCSFLGVILTASWQALAEFMPRNPIKIGVAFAFQGVWSDWAKRNVIALEMAIEEINAAGGVNGMPLKSVIYDTASKPDEADPDRPQAGQRRQSAGHSGAVFQFRV